MSKKKFIFVPVFGLMIAGNDALAANGYFTKFSSSKLFEDLKSKISFRSSVYTGYNYGGIFNSPFNNGVSKKTTKGQHSPIVGMNFDMLFKLNDRVSLVGGIDIAGMWPVTKIDFQNSLQQEASPASNTKAVLGNIDVYKKNVSEVSIDTDIAKTKGGTISHEHLSGKNDIIIKKPVIVDNSLTNTKDFSAISIVNATKPNTKGERRDIVVGQAPVMKDITVNVPADKKEVVVGQTPVTKNVTINVPVIYNGKVVGQKQEFHEIAKVKAKDITANVPVYERVVVGQAPVMKDITANIPVYERRTRQVPILNETGEVKMEDVTIGGFLKGKDRKDIFVGQTPVMEDVTVNVPTNKKEVVVGRTPVIEGQAPVMKDITANIPVYEKRVVGQAPMDYVDGKPIMKNITIGAPLYKKEVVVGQAPVMKDIIANIPVYERRVIRQAPVMKDITANIPVYEKRVVGQAPMDYVDGKPIMKNITIGAPLYKKEVVSRTSVDEKKDITVNIPVYERRVVGKVPVFNETGEIETKDITVNVPMYEKSETEMIRKIPQSAKETTVTIPKYEMIIENKGNTLSDNTFIVKTGVNTGERRDIVVGQKPVMKDITASIATDKKDVVAEQTQVMKNVTVSVPVYEKKEHAVYAQASVGQEIKGEIKEVTLKIPVGVIRTGVPTGERRDITAGQTPVTEDITASIPVYEKKEHAVKTPNIVKVGVRKIGVTTKQVPMFVNYEQDVATVPASNNIEEDIQISEQSSTQIKTKAQMHELLVEKDKEVNVLEPKQHIVNYSRDYSIREFGKLSANFGADIKITKYINLTIYGSAGINLARINYSENNIVSTFMDNELIDSKISSLSINKFNIGQTFSLGGKVLLGDRYEISASYRVSINSNSSIKSSVPLNKTIYTHNFMLTTGYRFL